MENNTTMTLQDRMNDFGFEIVPDGQDDLILAVEHALANFLGTDDLDQSQIELVSDCCRAAIAALPNWTYFGNLLEKASTYIEVDMDEETMEEFVGELQEQLEEYGLV